jgi:hypothetical protein
MKKNHRFVIPATSLAIISLTLACGVFSPQSQSQEQTPQSAPNVEGPAGASPETNPSTNNPTGIVSCTQLIQSDEVTNLLNNTPGTLSDNANPGGSLCVWQYTPTGSTGSHLFYLEVNFGTDAAALWEAKRSYELSQEPSDIVVNSIAGLGDESYVWSSKTTEFFVVFARRGDKTLVMRYIPQDVLYMANESGIIDMADRIFRRF